MRDYDGTPTDDAPAILATGGSPVRMMYVHISERHPDGDDVEYLAWHTFDHRPEQHRIASVQSSLRLVSTPECRAARAASDPSLDATDHVMTYFFADDDGLNGFRDLGRALHSVGRMPFRIPAVHWGAYHLEGMVAAPRVKVGAEVLAWYPAPAVYALIEQGAADASALARAPGVAGVWWARGFDCEILPDHDTSGLQVTYCFLDADPLDTARALGPLLDARWSTGEVMPLLAGPFRVPIPSELDRYLP
jgi:hypothetical protein